MINAITEWYPKCQEKGLTGSVSCVKQCFILAIFSSDIKELANSVPKPIMKILIDFNIFYFLITLKHYGCMVQNSRAIKGI